MIAQLNGTVTELGATWAVIEVGGVGIHAVCGPNTTTQLQVGQPARLATSLVVKEDSLTLYGFHTKSERDFFDLLLTASGVGPKLAQAALAVLDPDALRRAIGSEDLLTLTKVPGVGHKGAQRMVLELKDKVDAVAAVSAESSAVAEPEPAWREQVVQGLQGLGWAAKDAETASGRVEHLVQQDPSISVAELMRAALQTLAK